jgi:hypothetical protein
MDVDQPATGDEHALDGSEGCGESLPPPEPGERRESDGNLGTIIVWFCIVAAVVAVVLLARL